MISPDMGLAFYNGTKTAKTVSNISLITVYIINLEETGFIGLIFN